MSRCWHCCYFVCAMLWISYFILLDAKDFCGQTLQGIPFSSFKERILLANWSVLGLQALTQMRCCDCSILGHVLREANHNKCNANVYNAHGKSASL